MGMLLHRHNEKPSKKNMESVSAEPEEQAIELEGAELEEQKELDQPRRGRPKKPE